MGFNRREWRSMQTLVVMAVLIVLLMTPSVDGVKGEQGSHIMRRKQRSPKEQNAYVKGRTSQKLAREDIDVKAVSAKSPDEATKAVSGAAQVQRKSRRQLLRG